MLRRNILRLQHRYSVVRVTATKRVIKSFAQRHGLVYFGSVSQYGDEYQPVRGITLSLKQLDRHYCVGSIGKYDVILLQRSNSSIATGTTHVHTTWLIMQFDLYHEKPSLGTVIIDSGRHKAIYSELLQLKLPLLRPIIRNMTTVPGSQPAHSATVYASLQSHQMVSHIVSGSVLTAIAEHFKAFDFEITEGKLLVYSANTTVSLSVLEDMARAGTWLSQYVDSCSA